MSGAPTALFPDPVTRARTDTRSARRPRSPRIWRGGCSNSPRSSRSALARATRCGSKPACASMATISTRRRRPWKPVSPGRCPKPVALTAPVLAGIPGPRSSNGSLGRASGKSAWVFADSTERPFARARRFSPVRKRTRRRLARRRAEAPGQRSARPWRWPSSRPDMRRWGRRCSRKCAVAVSRWRCAGRPSRRNAIIAADRRALQQNVGRRLRSTRTGDVEPRANI